MQIFHSKTTFTILIIICSAILASGQTDSAVDTTKKSSKFSKDRFYYAGNLGLDFSNGILLAFSPIVGYKITERWSAGLGTTFIYYKDNHPVYGYQTTVFGGRIFSRFTLYEPLFAHLEYEVLNMEVYLLPNPDLVRLNVPSVFAGLGFTLPLRGSTSLYILVLYDFIQKLYSPYDNPLVRMGIGYGM